MDDKPRDRVLPSECDRSKFPSVITVPLICKRFIYKGRRVQIQDMGYQYRQFRYWYLLSSGIRECGGWSVEQAEAKVKADIDLAETLPIIPPNFKQPREKKAQN